MTPKGQYFDEYLGNTYQSEFLPLFDKFLATVFGIFISLKCSIIINYYALDKKTCDSRALPKSSPIVPPQSPSHNRDTKTAATREKKGPSNRESEYEEKRRANIKENEKLLASLGLGEEVAKLGESLSKKKKKKK